MNVSRFKGGRAQTWAVCLHFVVTCIQNVHQCIPGPRSLVWVNTGMFIFLSFASPCLNAQRDAHRFAQLCSFDAAIGHMLEPFSLLRPLCKCKKVYTKCEARLYKCTSAAENGDVRIIVKRKPGPDAISQIICRENLLALEPSCQASNAYSRSRELVEFPCVWFTFWSCVYKM